MHTRAHAHARTKRTHLLLHSPVDLQLFEAEMPMRRRLARKCVEHFFRMMFDHNFVHGDLHPGNLRVTGYTPDGQLALCLFENS